MVGLKQLSFTTIAAISLVGRATAIHDTSVLEGHNGQTQAVISNHGGKALDGPALRHQMSVGIPALAGQAEILKNQRPKKRGLKTRKNGRIRGAIGRNAGTAFDRTTNGITALGTVMGIVKDFQGQPQPPKKRGLQARKNGRIRGAIGRNAGTAFDRTTDGIAALGTVIGIVKDLKGQPQPPKKRGLQARKNGRIRGAIGRNAGTAFDRTTNGITALGTVVGWVKDLQGQPPKKRGIQARKNGKVRGAIRTHSGTAFDLTTDGIATLGTAYDVYKQIKSQGPKKRALDELERRAFEDYIIERYYF